MRKTSLAGDFIFCSKFVKVRNSSCQSWLDRGEFYCIFALTIINLFFENCTNIIPSLGADSYFFLQHGQQTHIQQENFWWVFVQSKNFPKWGKHVLTHLCVSVGLCVSRKFLSLNFGTRIHHPFFSGIYFIKSESIIWLKQCACIIVTGLTPSHMELIKDQYTIYETVVVPLLINETVIQQRVGDVGVVL